MAGITQRPVEPLFTKSLSTSRKWEKGGKVHLSEQWPFHYNLSSPPPPMSTALHNGQRGQRQRGKAGKNEKKVFHLENLMIFFQNFRVILLRVLFLFFNIFSSLLYLFLKAIHSSSNYLFEYSSRNAEEKIPFIWSYLPSFYNHWLFVSAINVDFFFIYFYYVKLTVNLNYF